MRHPILSVMSLLMLLLASCGTSPPSPATRIDPSTVQLEDHFKDQGRGDEHTFKIHVAPPAAPAPPAYLPPAPMPPAVPTAPTDGFPVAASSPAGGSEIKLGGDRTIAAPSGSSVDIEVHDAVQPQQTSHDRTAASAGPTLRTDKDAGQFNASAPQVSLSASDDHGSAGGAADGNGSSGKAGSMDYSWTTLVSTVSAASTGQKWLWGIGILLIVAALAMVVVEHIIGGRADWALFGLLVAGGIGFITVGIVAEKYPAFFLLLALGALGGIIWYVIYWKKRSEAGKAAAANSG